MSGEIIPWLRRQLEPISETASLDAQVLLAHILGKPRSWLLAHPEIELTEPQENALRLALEHLQNGQPLPYVLGEWEFYGLTFHLTPVVLIPRPETELLVDHALRWLKTASELSLRASKAISSPAIAASNATRSPSKQPARQLSAIDVGTGSGCIAISLAASLPGLSIIASDSSLLALQVARRNVQRHQVAGQVDLVQSNLLSTFASQPIFHLICANLPYIPSRTLPSLSVAQHEPALALDGGPEGTTLIELLLEQASRRLAPGGLLLVEIEVSQGRAVPDLARQAFPAAKIRLHQDLAQRDRLVSILLPQ